MKDSVLDPTVPTGYTYHLVPLEYYEAQDAEQAYQPQPMVKGREDFIHCTTGADELAATGNRYYTADPREFIALVLDLDQVKAPTRYDNPNHIYPHIYGPLNRDAIVRIVKIPRDEQGRFLPPED